MLTDKYEIISFLEKGESYIKGKELIKRAKKLNAELGKKEAEYFLEHQDEIPKEWQDKYIIFTDYTEVRSNGGLCVAGLYWDGDKWELHFLWVDRDFCDGFVLPRDTKTLGYSFCPHCGEKLEHKCKF